MNASRAWQCTVARALGVWLVLCAVCFSHARAQPTGDIPVRAISVTFHNVPSLSFSVRDLVDSEVVKKLQSGLPQTLTTRIYAYADRGRDPLAVGAVSCRVVYDLWEGVYRIERHTESNDKTVSTRALDGVVSQCLSFQNYTLGSAKLFQRVRGSSLYFAVVTELNPLSADAVQRIRRWLARPAGSELNGNAFFGSFVSIFVSRKLGAADKVLSFRSNIFVVPP